MFPLKEIAYFLSRVFKFRFRNGETDQRVQPFQFLSDGRQDFSNLMLVFSVEGALLRSSSSSDFFPYFMLVAFEAGSLIRAFILLSFYPIICLLNAHDLGLRIMVMICFLGLRQDRLSAIGRAVLSKFLLEDVGLESFEVLRRHGKKIGVTNLPLVMVESFLREYLDVDFVVGRELKVFRGYFLGMLTENKRTLILEAENTLGDHVNMVGIISNNNESHHHLFSICKEIYVVSEEEKRQWRELPRDMYPRPLIFHDGRLAFRPTFLRMLVTFIWFPVGLFLSIVRITLGYFPYGIALPMTAFTGFRIRVVRRPESDGSAAKGTAARLYVCNHRTLLDPVLLSVVLKNPVCAVTYSVSWISEFLSPIKTVRLRRDRDKDAKIMEKILSSEKNLVVCPEGTTCREPYLLRFSALFAELSSENKNIIVPVAVDSCVSMFHGTTAGGMKLLDPFYFLMNAFSGYAFELLESVGDELSSSKVEVANMVQKEIGKALGFTCTNLTRKDKYRILTG